MDSEPESDRAFKVIDFSFTKVLYPALLYWCFLRGSLFSNSLLITWEQLKTLWFSVVLCVIKSAKKGGMGI